ncbi:uncharacterized protein LOC113750555 [Coffea eugenioides]|uniref:uncharacterized protein LOC113750555 n=1 Tax=Coffea eugenioides TaxID=49369 RepID=UPI000F61280D|nr:uncharacterized protein LOC113750555 [Coffea eugenioides]
MTNILACLVEQQGQVPRNQPRDDMGQDRALERLQKFSPPKFLGGPDPEGAERLLETMINIFAALNYAEDRQVQFAIFQFEGPARAWWNEKRKDDFINLRQGTLRVSECETQFTKLSKFAPELIATEQRRIRRFVQELNVEIQEALAAAQINTFTEVLEKAQRIEIARVGQRDAGEKISGTPKEITPRGTSRGREQARGASQGGQTSAPRVSCGFCGKAIILRMIVGERQENVYGVIVSSTSLQLVPVGHTQTLNKQM